MRPSSRNGRRTMSRGNWQEQIERQMAFIVDQRCNLKCAGLRRTSDGREPRKVSHSTSPNFLVVPPRVACGPREFILGPTPSVASRQKSVKTKHLLILTVARSWYAITVGIAAKLRSASGNEASAKQPCRSRRHETGSSEIVEIELRRFASV